MLYRVKNWKLTLLALIMIAFLTRLGFWQLARAHEKKHILQMFNTRTQATPLNVMSLGQIQDPAYFRITLTGHFDNAHSFLLDNKIYKGRVGFELYTPFYADKLDQPLLIDRGFIPIITTRQNLPPIKPIIGSTHITGLITPPPGYVKLGHPDFGRLTQWPAIVEYLNPSELSRLLQINFYPYVVHLQPNDPASYPIEWQVISLSPERHLGYAVQWFALALTLLILSVALNWRFASNE